MVYFVAFGCNNNSCSSKNISFFRFPADAAQRREWTRRIRVLVGDRRRTAACVHCIFLPTVSLVSVPVIAG